MTNRTACAIIVSVELIAELCNGSTTDSDSVCEGSNPSSPAKKKARLGVLFSTKSVLVDGINPPLVDEIALR